MDEKIEFAKKIFLDHACIIDWFNDEEKAFFDSCDIPKDVIKDWVYEYLNNETTECYALINEYIHNKRLEVDYYERITIKLAIIIEIVYVHEINYYRQILDLLNKLSEADLLIDCINDCSGFGGQQSLHKGFFLWNKEDPGYIYPTYSYYFETDEKFIGLLPYLYKGKRIELFEEFFIFLLKYCPLYISFETMIDYCNFINRRDLLLRVNEALKQYNERHNLLETKAKEILIKNNYDFNSFSSIERKEWDEYQVPDYLIKEWMSTYVSKILHECEMLTKNPFSKQDEDVNIKKVCDNLVTVMKMTYDHVLDDFNYYAVTSYLWRLGYYKYSIKNYIDSEFILCDKERNNGNNYYFETKERYVGLLPYLYKKQKWDSFKNLFDVLLEDSLKIISLEELLDFCNFIKKDKYIKKVRDALAKYS